MIIQTALGMAVPAAPGSLVRSPVPQRVARQVVLRVPGAPARAAGRRWLAGAPTGAPLPWENPF
jgi:hypothetical protein